MLASSTTALASSTSVLASSADTTSGSTVAVNAATDAGTSLSLTPPGGTLVGDLLLVAVSTRDPAEGLITGPGSWFGGGQATTGSGLVTAVFYKIATSTDLTTAHNFQWAVSTRATAVMLTLRGLDQSFPLITSVVSPNNASLNVDVPGLTMAAAQSVLVIVASKAYDSVHSQTPGWTLDSEAFGNTTGGSAGVAESIQFKNNSLANPPAVTVTAGAGSATSVGFQFAFAVGSAVGTNETLNPGSYALTGVAASLVTNYVMTASPGSYAVTEKQATEGSANALTASPGSYAVTGVLANFAAPTITWTTLATVGAVGTYSDTTATASTRYYYRVVALNAAQETPSNIDDVTTFASSSYLFTASPGAYSLAGTQVGLTDPIRESMEVGSYALTGVAMNPVNPGLNWEILAIVDGTTGSYNDVGVDPLTTYVYRVWSINATGEYESNRDLVTTPAATVNEQFTASKGNYALTGKVTSISFEVNVPASSYAVTGRLANFTLVQKVISDPETYDLTGAPVNLEPNLFISALPGSYAVTGVAQSFVRARVGQQALPASDLIDGTWVPSAGTDLYQTLDDPSDDPPADADYIRATNPNNDEARVALDPLQPPQDGTVTVLVRVGKG